MNDGWVKQDGTRWSRRERDRVAERFRSYVRTPSNPTGPIIRQRCPLHPEKERSEFHHLDYAHPFLGVWCCFSCHRKIDHGDLSVIVAVWDYSAVVAPRLRPGLIGNRNAVRDAMLPQDFEEAEEETDVPF